MENRNKKRALWSQTQLQHGMKLVQDGYSQHQASILSGIPRRTLRNHINTKSMEKKIGRSAILNKDQEKDLAARIIRFAETGLPLTPLGVRRCVYQYCEMHNIPHTFNTTKKYAGRKWYRGFMSRNPNIRQRKAQNMNMARAQKLNRYIVNDYFEKLKKVLDQSDYCVEPQRIYNMDEKGCRLTIHHQQTVLAKCGAKRVHLLANEHAENVTIVACVNAIGHTIPPMILFKGKRKKPTYDDNLPAQSIVGMTEKGSMTVVVFNSWLDHFAKFKGPGKVLLILDGAKCHLDLSICLKAEQHEIEIFCLPSNTTHELQPLDKSCFRPFEHYWDDELLCYWNTYPNRTLNKERFGCIFTPVWNKCMSMTNITSGFSSTGIYPYNPNIIPDVAFQPSLLTEKPASGPTLGELDDESDADEPEEICLATREGSIPTQSPSNITQNEENISPPFSSVLPSPEVTTTKKRAMKKSINYKAVVLNKNLFPGSEEGTPGTSGTSDGSTEGKNDQKKGAKKRKIENKKNQAPEVEVQNQNVEKDADDAVLATLLVQKGDFVISKLIYNFGTKKQSEKLFVAEVEKINIGRNRDQIMLKFLKKVVSSKDEEMNVYFHFPNIPDKLPVSRDQIQQIVTLKNVIRGRYYFDLNVEKSCNLS